MYELKLRGTAFSLPDENIVEFASSYAINHTKAVGELSEQGAVEFLEFNGFEISHIKDEPLKEITPDWNDTLAVEHYLDGKGNEIFRKEMMLQEELAADWFCEHN